MFFSALGHSFIVFFKLIGFDVTGRVSFASGPHPGMRTGVFLAFVLTLLQISCPRLLLPPAFPISPFVRIPGCGAGVRAARAICVLQAYRSLLAGMNATAPFVAHIQHANVHKLIG